MKPLPVKNRVLTQQEVERINERANKVFAVNPNVNSVYACLDGQIFLTKEKNAAEAHARKLKQAELIEVIKGTPVEVDAEALAQEQANAEAAQKQEIEKRKLTIEANVSRFRTLYAAQNYADALQVLEALTAEEKEALSDDVKLEVLDAEEQLKKGQ